MDSLTHMEGIPLYVKIRETIRDNINTGLLQKGAKLPSEDELAAKYGISRMTLRQGLTDLIDEGLLYRRHGVGTFVTHHHLDRDHSRLTSFFETSEMEGIQVSERLLKQETIAAKFQVAKALNLMEGELVIFFKTLRYIENDPVTIHEAYIPHNLCSHLLQADLLLESKDLWGFYERCGYRVKQGVQKLEARQADEETATLLRVEEGSPILYKERTLFSEDGTPIEFLYCYNRGDMYSLTVTLFR